jgi:LPS-assembly lipoprotein
MQRRFILSAMAASAGLLMAGCGFELRKAPNFPFKTLFSPFPESSLIGTQLRRSLESSGAVKVIADARFIDQADVVLDVLQEQREKVVVSRNSFGQVREFQLRLRFRFKLRTPQGKELIPDSLILQERDISFNESAALSKETEEGLLYREMQTDTVQQIMRRLAAVTTL